MTSYQFVQRSDGYDYRRREVQMPKVHVQTTYNTTQSNIKIMLTQDALLQLAATLPQPISTTKFSNRVSDENKFSDRESEGCPSLSSSPVSTNSSTTTVSLATVPDDFLPSRDFANKVYQLPISINAKPSTNTYKYIEPDYRSYKYDEPVRTNIRDVDFQSRRPQREQSPQQYKDYATPFPEIKKEVKKERKPIIMSFIPARPAKPAVEFTDVQTSSPTSTTLIIPSFNLKGHRKQSSERSIEATATTETVVIHEEPLELCPTRREEVKDIFVDTVFTYLSFPHESIAKNFDTEIAEGSGMTVDKVKSDRKVALKEYIARYVQEHPEIRAGEGCW